MLNAYVAGFKVNSTEFPVDFAAYYVQIIMCRLVFPNNMHKRVKRII